MERTGDGGRTILTVSDVPPIIAAAVDGVTAVAAMPVERRLPRAVTNTFGNPGHRNSILEEAVTTIIGNGSSAKV